MPYAIAAVKDALLRQPDHYFNSGVLFFYSDLWHFSSDDFIQATLDNPEFQFKDQDVLNLLIGNQYLQLDKRYNYQQGYAYPDIIEFKQGKEKQFIFPKIIHYTDNLKPWHRRTNIVPIYKFNNILLKNYQTDYFHFTNIYDFYAMLPWNEIVDMPINHFQPIVKQFYKLNFDYVVQGDAKIELVD
ncbi:glycosyltransferase [Lonepinella sp. BR2357]|uniref:glycosyltransferase n=1 Tax=Lonepinella sp. BR2357 TaxID=3434549 RepID=UPI003F6E2542